jgi:hypothetical protein
VVPLTWKLPYFKEKESKNRSQFLWQGKNMEILKVLVMKNGKQILTRSDVQQKYCR